MKKILYIGNFSFPLGNAAGKRVYANGKVLRELNYEVVFIGLDKTIGENKRLKEKENNHDGFTFYNFDYPKSSVSWINYRKKFNSLVELIEDNFKIDEIEMVIYYGSPSLSLFIYKLIKYCKANKVKIVSDCVDWLTVKTDNHMFNFIKWADNTYQKAYLNKKVDGVIAISNYLEHYYNRAKLKTVIIPPLSPVTFNDLVKYNRDYKLIVYAGIPFRKGQVIKDLSTLKDRIDKVILILNEVKSGGVNFEFHVYGFTKAEYLEVIPAQRDLIDALGNSILFHGITPNDEVTKEISKADYTILFRDVNRDTTAGFPTKVSESISFGTPVLTTKSSDIDLYIRDGYNGFYFDYELTRDSISKMREVLSKDADEINLLKNNCVKDGLFHYKRYVNTMNSFIRSL